MVLRSENYTDFPTIWPQHRKAGVKIIYKKVRVGIKISEFNAYASNIYVVKYAATSTEYDGDAAERLGTVDEGLLDIGGLRGSGYKGSKT